MADITEFCRRITCIHEDPNELWYLRAKTGRTRKTAELIFSGWIITGDQPLKVERELEERLRAVGGEEPVWIEALQKNTSQIKDCLKIDPDESPELQVGDRGIQYNLDVLCGVLRDVVIAEQRRGQILSSQLMEAQAQLMLAWKETIYLSATSGQEEGSDMAQAIAAFAPMVPAIAQKLGESKAPPPQSPAEEADNLVSRMIDLANLDPSVVTPERLTRLASLYP
jgi:hypothetical protein